MHHDTPLISTIVAGLVLAFIFGAIANRFRMPPLVGYLLAGVVVGPFTPGFVADGELATELSELGVILLMFGVGLHFSLKDLLSVRAVAVPGAVVQIAGATALGCGLGLMLGWGLGAGLIFGLALSVASTVVLLKALQDRRLIESEKGKIAVGWLIVEDMAMVLALVLIPAVASLATGSGAQIDDPFVNFTERMAGIELGIPGVLAVTVLKLAAFVGFMLVVGRRVIPFVLHFTAHTGSRELFRLAVLAIALGVAAGAAYLFGVSLALGAFFAGMILSESELSHRAAQESLPLRDAFAVLFFVAVGMLFDPGILIRDPLPLLATVFIILIGKSIFAFVIVLAFRQPVGTALIISASLAQIGEFSFILATLGVSLDILPAQAKDLILGGAIISIILNPVMFWLADQMRPALEGRFPGRLAAQRVEPSVTGAMPGPEPLAAAVTEDAEATPQPTALTDHTILIGYGRVGTVVAEGLLASEAPFLIIEDAEARINAARAAGIEVVIGNAASSKVLGLANVAGARTCVIAIPNAFEAGQAVEQCRKQNAGLAIIARAHSDEEEQHLLHLGANAVIMGEREIALGMLELVQRDSSAVAEMVASDAVAAALGTPIMAPPPPGPAEGPLTGSAPVPMTEVPRPVLGAVAPGPLTQGDAQPPGGADAMETATLIDHAPADAETLLEEIEAAPVQHADAGPAEPPAVVSAYGEEPDPTPAVEPVAEPAASPDALPFKARQPARTPATPFNPEVAPPGPPEK